MEMFPPLHVAELAYPLPEGFKEGGASGRGEGTQVTYPRDLRRLLRLDDDCKSWQHHHKHDQ